MYDNGDDDNSMYDNGDDRMMIMILKVSMVCNVNDYDNINKLMMLKIMV